MLMALLAFPAAMIVAAGTDLWRMTIPNTLVIVLALAFFPYALGLGLPLPAIGLHLAAGFAFLILGILFFALNWMGGGDAKLIAAAALWLGPGPELLRYLLLASVLGGVLTLALLLSRRLVAPATGHSSIDRLLDPANGAPYGVALGIAGLLVTPSLPGAAMLFAGLGLGW
ncbi:A24 family peptidase [Aureimonas jatrophae]|uniref:Prepilin peptidase CpaA n=1 Tax=Aureimonas jatrophae TaxID=1166073 RepID=A0A1H0LTZ2_9HYPH|nr:prepilin peptidase [Aureimonas jatrophae]MBB3952744.1 prepilin peptidase CpaA [Aureimonas jatrophae]SDO71575.1 prepilin peptidase CpaA [Aureimonas jatrophae]